MASGLGLTLLRHGLTKENERHQYIGWLDSSLSSQGRLAVKQLQGQLPVVDMVFASDLRRCTETAAILYPDYPIETMETLREMSFGKWEGKTYQNLKHNPKYRAWLDDIFTRCPDGGESFSTFSERVMAGFNDVVRIMHEQNVCESAIVTHGGVIRYLLTRLTSVDSSFFDWQIPYGCGYRLYWENDILRGNERCTSLQVVPITEKQSG